MSLGKPIGVPVSIKLAHEQPAATDKAEEIKAIDKPEDQRWGDAPQFKDQLNHEHLWREGARRTVVFNIADPVELEKWNAEQASCSPATSPRQILLAEPTVHELGGRLILVANLQKIEYAQVISSPPP